MVPLRMYLLPSRLLLGDGGPIYRDCFVLAMFFYTINNVIVSFVVFNSRCILSSIHVDSVGLGHIGIPICYSLPLK